MEKQKFIGENIKKHLFKKNPQTPQAYYDQRELVEAKRNEKLTGKKFDLKKAKEELSKLKDSTWKIRTANDNFFVMLNKFLKQPGTYFYNPPKPYLRRRTTFAFHILKKFESGGLNTGMFDKGDTINFKAGSNPQIIFKFAHSKKPVIFDLKTFQFKNKSDIPKHNQSLAEKHKAARENIKEHAKSLLATLNRGTVYSLMNLLGIKYNRRNLIKLYRQAQKYLGPKATGRKSEIIFKYITQKYGPQLRKLIATPKSSSKPPVSPHGPAPTKPAPPPVKPKPPQAQAFPKKAPIKPPPPAPTPKSFAKAQPPATPSQKWTTDLLKKAQTQTKSPKTHQQAYDTYLYILRNPQDASPQTLKKARKSLHRLSRTMLSQGTKRLSEMHKKMPALGNMQLSTQYAALLKKHLNPTTRPTLQAARNYILANLDKLVKDPKLKNYILSQQNITDLAIRQMSEPDPRKKQYLHLQMIDRLTGNPTKLTDKKKNAILRMYIRALESNKELYSKFLDAGFNENITDKIYQFGFTKGFHTIQGKKQTPKELFTLLKPLIQNPKTLSQAQNDAQADALIQMHLILIGPLSKAHLAILNKRASTPESIPSTTRNPEKVTIEKAESLIKAKKYAQAKDHLESILQLHTNLSTTDRKKAEKLLDNLNEKHSKEILAQRKEKYLKTTKPGLREFRRSLYLLEQEKIGPAIHNLEWLAKNNPNPKIQAAARHYLRIINIKILKKFKSIAKGMKESAAKKAWWRRWAGLSSLEAGYEQDYAKLADRFIRLIRTQKAYSIPTAKDHILSKRTWGTMGLRFYLSRNRSAMEQFYGSATSREDSSTQLHFKYLLAKRLSGSLTDVTSFSQAQNLYLSIIANNETIKTKFVEYTKKNLQKFKSEISRLPQARSLSNAQQTALALLKLKTEFFKEITKNLPALFQSSTYTTLEKNALRGLARLYTSKAISTGLDKAMNFLLNKFPITRSINKIANNIDKAIKTGKKFNPSKILKSDIFNLSRPKPPSSTVA